MVATVSANGIGSGDKAMGGEALAHSVVSTPEVATTQAIDVSFLNWVAQTADAIVTWGQAPKVRDRQLRQFIPSESYLMGALGTVCARNAGFSWKLEGPDRTVRHAQDMLLNANGGMGYEDFAITTSHDLYEQDCGAFVELIRLNNGNENNPVIGIQQLDSARCFMTGNPLEPVYYRDIKERWHPLKWYQVIMLHEMPSPIEHPFAGVLYRLQYCAVTRALRNAQIIRNIAVYEDEKTGGRFLKGIHLIGGFGQKAVDDGIRKAQTKADNEGYIRYQQPAVIASPNELAKIEHKLIELASLPDHFSKEETMKWHIANLALAFLTDYQEFAPLPGGGLGTATQSQTLTARSRGKGPALYQKLMAHAFNFRGILPRNVSLRYTEQDLAAEAEQASLREARATTAATRITAGITDALAERQLALNAGDITQEIFDELATRKPEESSRDDDNTVIDDKAPKGSGNVTPGETVLNDEVTASSKALAVLIARGVKGDTGTQLGELLQSRIHKAFTDTADDLYALGWLNTDGRISLSGVIGDTLRYFAEQLDDEAWEIVNQNVDAEDVRLLIGAMESKAGTKEIPKGRRSLENETVDEFADILEGVQGTLAKELRSRKKPAEGAIIAGERAAVVRKEQRLVRDGDGIITGAETLETVEAWK